MGCEHKRRTSATNVLDNDLYRRRRKWCAGAGCYRFSRALSFAGCARACVRAPAAATRHAVAVAAGTSILPGAAHDSARLHDDGGYHGVCGRVNLRPAEAEPAVADDKGGTGTGRWAGRQLPNNGLHCVCSAAWYDGSGVGVVSLLENSAAVFHDMLKVAAHVVERAVRVHD